MFSFCTSIFWYKKGRLAWNEILDKLQKLDSVNNTTKKVNIK